MLGGVPVATVAIGGGKNAGILAAQILGTSDDDLRTRITTYKANLHQQARAMTDDLQMSNDK